MEHTINLSYDNIDNRFLFVMIAAKRALQLQKGARPRVDAGTKKPTMVAMAELLDNRVKYELPTKPKEKKSKK